MSYIPFFHFASRMYVQFSPFAQAGCPFQFTAPNKSIILPFKLVDYIRGTDKELDVFVFSTLSVPGDCQNPVSDI